MLLHQNIKYMKISYICIWIVFVYCIQLSIGHGQLLWLSVDDMRVSLKIDKLQDYMKQDDPKVSLD